MLAGDELIALDDTDREADEIELSRLHRARVFGHLAAHEGAARRSAAFGDALDELLDVGRIELADRDVVEEEQRLGALAQTRSSTHMATRSMPIVSNCPTAWAMSAFVPTPSVDETSTGLVYRCCGKANRPPKPPMSPMTSGRYVERTSSLIASTASSPAVMSTPASL